MASNDTSLPASPPTSTPTRKRIPKRTHAEMASSDTSPLASPTTTAPTEKRFRAQATFREIAGYPQSSEPLPDNLTHHDITSRFPNHLRGAQLIEIREMGWGSPEIAAACPAAEITANVIDLRWRRARKALKPGSAKKDQGENQQQEGENTVPSDQHPAERRSLANESARQSSHTASDRRRVAFLNPTVRSNKASTSSSGKRVRDEPEQYDLDEEALPSSRRRIQVNYTPGTTPPGKNPSRSAGTTKDAMGRGSRLKQGTTRVFPGQGVVIQTNQIFDPFAALDLAFGNQPSDGFASTSTREGSQGPGATPSQQDNSVPRPWGSLPGIHSSGASQRDVRRPRTSSLDQSPETVTISGNQVIIKTNKTFDPFAALDWAFGNRPSNESTSTTRMTSFQRPVTPPSQHANQPPTPIPQFHPPNSLQQNAQIPSATPPAQRIPTNAFPSPSQQQTSNPPPPYEYLSPRAFLARQEGIRDEVIQLDPNWVVRTGTSSKFRKRGDVSGEEERALVERAAGVWEGKERERGRRERGRREREREGEEVEGEGREEGGGAGGGSVERGSGRGEK